METFLLLRARICESTEGLRAAIQKRGSGRLGRWETKSRKLVVQNSEILTLAAAEFVLLAAVARTRIVSADFGTDADGSGLFHGSGGLADNVTALGSPFCARRRRRRRGIGARGRAAEGAGGL